MQKWLAENSPIDNEDLERHDKWLCMMWPRLHLLRELLAEDGAIFISIDDNEQYHLRMLMDGIFGEENFVASLIWRSRLGRGGTTKNIATLQEYILIYAKHIDFATFRSDTRIRETESTERLRQWGQFDRREDAPTMYYPVYSDEFGEVYPVRSDGTDGRWRVGKSTMAELINDSRVVFKKQSDGRIEAYKIIPAGTKTYTAYSSLLDSEVVKTTAHGSIELKNILGPDKFPYPKPSLLIKELMSLCTQGEDIILDSFAGSGTTAHAVLSLNKEDGGNRKFILVECEEYADTITAERVRRVINGVPNATDKTLQAGLGGSFTYCTLGEPIDEEGMLTGEHLPSYEALASYIAYTATGHALTRVEKAEDFCFGETDAIRFYLIYEPELTFLESDASALNLERAEQIAEACKKIGKKAQVYAPHKFVSQKELTAMGITFCQLPYNIHRNAE